MSKKNVGGASIPNDNYPTPKPYIRALIRSLPAAVFRPGITFLDPCCGAGAMLDVVDEEAVGGACIFGIELQENLALMAGAKGHVVETADALAPSCVWPKTDLIISNFPYTYAEEFFRKSLASIESGGTVSVLLRLGFLASDERAPFFDEFGMPHVQVVKRPSFCTTVRCKECGDRYTLPPEGPRPKVCRCADPNWAQENLRVVTKDGVCPGAGKDLSISTTDAADYAWMTYGPHHAPTVSRLEIGS